MRLNRFLASAGLGSRRGVEDLIRLGRVRVNGRVITDLSTTVGPDDSVKIGNRVLRPERTVTIALYKPAGYVCTARDEQGRRTIFDLLPQHWPRLFHIGRLDHDSEGLLLVTNDGELSLILTHPRFHVEKEYEVGLNRPLEPTQVDKLLHGFRIEGGWAKAEQISALGPQLFRVVLRQGLKRQIRLMFYKLGYEVTHLRRVRIGPLKLGRLRPGEWRVVAKREIESLRRAAQVATGRGSQV